MSREVTNASRTASPVRCARDLTYEDLIARARHDRAAMIKALLRRFALWIKSLCRQRRPATHTYEDYTAEMERSYD
jgi:hypothetical protein